MSLSSKKYAIIVLLSSFVSMPAFAANGYFGIGAGQNGMDITGVKASTAYSVLLGYAFNENFAGEISYVDFGSADTATPSVSATGNAAALAVVGSLPLSREFSVFAKLGYASTSIKNTGGSADTRSDLTYGIGAQYNFNKSFGMRLGYDVYKVGASAAKDSSYTNIGVVFNF